MPRSHHPIEVRSQCLNAMLHWRMNDAMEQFRELEEEHGDSALFRAARIAPGDIDPRYPDIHYNFEAMMSAEEVENGRKTLFQSHADREPLENNEDENLISTVVWMSSTLGGLIDERNARKEAHVAAIAQKEKQRVLAMRLYQGERDKDQVSSVTRGKDVLEVKVHRLQGVLRSIPSDVIGEYHGEYNGSPLNLLWPLGGDLDSDVESESDNNDHQEDAVGEMAVDEGKDSEREMVIYTRHNQLMTMFQRAADFHEETCETEENVLLRGLVQQLDLCIGDLIDDKAADEEEHVLALAQKDNEYRQAMVLYRKEKDKAAEVIRRKDLLELKVKRLQGVLRKIPAEVMCGYHGEYDGSPLNLVCPLGGDLDSDVESEREL
ncbi:hypothetical protein KIPB_001821 [Kipferlia bialata]|uniref:Uncharacterized protein n=1 Tax=Kipferlia bialata TaxID=797122 RepID=A0A391NPD0_9EUKA|nr:hypothetical protein KIPB_001821 [Kipferlia bialata]|eukprot:g1821.t1